MRVYSVEEARSDLEALENEMTELADNMVKGVDREASLARLNEIQPNVAVLTAKVEDAGEGEVPSIRVDAGLKSKALEAESTVANTLEVVDALLSRVLEVHDESNDEDRAEIVKRVSAVESIGNAAGLKPASGRGSRLSPATVTEIRTKFQAAWEENSEVNYTKFIEANGISANLYTVIQIVNGKSYATVEGPVRGVDYDTEATPETAEEPTTETAAA